jgi:hypothetical protein
MDMMESFIVEYFDYKSGLNRLVRVQSKDKIHAAIDAVWPVTVWSEEEFKAGHSTANVDEKP